MIVANRKRPKNSDAKASRISQKGTISMAKYAIAFVLDADTLSKTYTRGNQAKAYAVIEDTLRSYGFSRQQGSVYFGDDKVDAVRTVMAARRLATKHVWFAASVRDIRMLRIEDDNDLMPAIQDETEN